jgi:hypothetical protein
VHARRADPGGRRAVRAPVAPPALEVVEEREHHPAGGADARVIVAGCRSGAPPHPLEPLGVEAVPVLPRVEQRQHRPAAGRERRVVGARERERAAA